MPQLYFHWNVSRCEVAMVNEVGIARKTGAANLSSYRKKTGADINPLECPPRPLCKGCVTSKVVFTSLSRVRCESKHASLARSLKTDTGANAFNSLPKAA